MTTERGELPADAELILEAWPETDRYALVDEIARGGGGRIAIAVDRKLGRRVALKRPLDVGGARRLEREALVMARLEHPSIVPVHDAGRDPDGAPFYAMKLLGGPNLSERIKDAADFETRLGLLRVVGAVADAMAYAHARGVIHRDLKPANVVVGEFGEVAVIDWGLAKAVGDPEQTPSSSTISAELTRQGDVMGTPAYMAPEQARGEAVDERADVYALGAMLYQVLTGELPYGRITGDAQLARLLAGPPPPVDEREPRVPAELAAIVGKAMARVPDDRYPTAGDFAEDLHRYETGRLVAAHRYTWAMRARRWGRRHVAAIAIGFAAAATAGAAAFALTRTRVADTCVDLDAPVRSAWGAPQRDAIARAFAASGVPSSATQLRAVIAALDDRAARIAAMRREVCIARVRGEQSADIADRRMVCLDRRIGEQRVVADALASADRKVVEHADDPLGALARVEDCADVPRLRDAAPLPGDPRLRAEIAAIDDEIDRLSAARLTGHEVEAAMRAPAMVGRALVAGYPPQIAAALGRFGSLLSDEGHADRAVPVLKLAIVAAERGGVPRAHASSLNELAFLSYDQLDRLDEAEQYAAEAEAIATQLDDAELLSSAINAQAGIASRRGDNDRAIALARRALAIEVPGELPVRRAEGIGQLAAQLIHARRFDEAEAELDRALAIFRGALGTDDHHDIAIVLQNLGTIAYQRHDYDRAADDFAKAGAIFEKILAPDAPSAIAVEMDQAVVMTGAGRYPEAQTLLESLLRRAHARQPGGEVEQEILYNLGDVLRYQDHLDDAIARYREALALRRIAEATAGDAARTQAAIASTLLDAKRPAEALAELEPALAELARITGPDSYDTAYARVDLGRARLLTGDARGAIEPLTRALPEIDAEGDIHDRGSLRFYLAQARWGAGDHAAALALAAAARPLLAASQHQDSALRDLDAWLAAHR